MFFHNIIHISSKRYRHVIHTSIVSTTLIFFLRNHIRIIWNKDILCQSNRLLGYFIKQSRLMSRLLPSFSWSKFNNLSDVARTYPQGLEFWWHNMTKVLNSPLLLSRSYLSIFCIELTVLATYFLTYCIALHCRINSYFYTRLLSYTNLCANNYINITLLT